MMKPIYNLPSVQFVGGSYQNIRFHLESPSAEAFDTDNHEVNFSIMRWGYRGKPSISKRASLIPDRYGYTIEINLLPSETVHLHGKFIYQVSILDASGYVEIPGRGIMDIIRNINPETVPADSGIVVSLTTDGAMTISGDENASGYTVDYTDGVMTVSK